MAAYALEPLATIQGTAASVSTLLTTVGSPHRPFSAGCGGRWSGWARRSSSARSRTVSSPSTNEPDRARTSTDSSLPVPIALAPR